MSSSAPHCAWMDVRNVMFGRSIYQTPVDRLPGSGLGCDSPFLRVIGVLMGKSTSVLRTAVRAARDSLLKRKTGQLSNPSSVFTGRAVKAIIFIAIIATLVLFVLHIRSYFFVFDDFALVRESAETPLREIFNLSLFAFYRPFAFTITKAQYGFFGWRTPAAYIAVSLVIHVANVCLVYAIVRRLSNGVLSSSVASVLFLMSPWSAEAYLWVSGRFDLLATCGSLAALRLGLVVVQGNRRHVILATLGGWLAMTSGVLSKETGVFTPIMLALMLALAVPWQGVRARRWSTLVYLIGLALIDAAYLRVRERLLPGLGGAYGDLSTLMRGANVGHNLWTYVLAMGFVPVGHLFSSAASAERMGLRIGFMVALLVAFLNLWRDRWRIILLGTAGFLIALSPLLWGAYPLDSSGGGRFLYLPGAWVALMIGIGLGRAFERTIEHPSHVRHAVIVVIAAVTFVYPLESLAYQSRIWRNGFAMARAAMEQVRPYAGSNQKVFITNLPFWFVEGPYILKDYAFTCYFGGTIAVRARAMNVSYNNGAMGFAGWLADSARMKPAADERVVTLQIPVRGVPSSTAFPWDVSADAPVLSSTIADATAVAAQRPKVSALANLTRFADVDGDGRADFMIYRPSKGVWLALRSSTNFTEPPTVIKLGGSTDTPVTGDYDGDGRADAALYTPETGQWSIARTRLGPVTYQYGLRGLPVPADYDGDGLIDVAAWRPADGVWYILPSSLDFTTPSGFQWGTAGDVPVAGDFDGDRITDLAVWRPATGTWWVRHSSTHYATSAAVQWGLSGDITVPGDYDGDGRTDLAVYRPLSTTWYFLTSSSNFKLSVGIHWGLSDDIPVPADYDGDGKTDIAVWRPSAGTWHVLKSSANFSSPVSYQWGISGDVPVMRRQ